MLRARFRALTANSKQVRSEQIIAEVTRYQNEWGRGVIDVVREYPPEKPHSRYRRTHDLYGGWKVATRLTASSLITIINNEMHYAVRVHGDSAGKGQWIMHRSTGWLRLYDYLKRTEYNRNIRAIFRRNISSKGF